MLWWGFLRSAGRKEFEKFLHEERVFFKRTAFFQILFLPLIAGNPTTALKEPNTLVLTEKMAKKYFWRRESPGKTPGDRE